MPTGDWEMYSAEIEGENALVYVRTDLKPIAPDPKRPWYLTITLRVKSQRADGFTEKSETEFLWSVEDQLEREIGESFSGVYVGRYSCAGKSVMACYLPAEPDVAIINSIVNRIAPGYEFELDGFEQPEWENYLRFLYPNEIAWQEIRNEGVLDSLRKHGDPLTPERHTLHWIYFVKRDQRDGFIRALLRCPIKFDVVDPLDPDQDSDTFGVRLEHQCSMDKNKLLKVQVKLLRIAQEFEGDYDGFECAVYQPD